MLVLTRTIGASILVGDDLEVQVDRITGESVELKVTRREFNSRLTTETFHPLRVNEQVDLGDGCVCAMLELRQDQVRLGFTVPKTTSVCRKEVLDDLRRRMRGDS